MKVHNNVIKWDIHFIASKQTQRTTDDVIGDKGEVN